jgi:hypothetical protein
MEILGQELGMATGLLSNTDLTEKGEARHANCCRRRTQLKGTLKRQHRDLRPPEGPDNEDLRGKNDGHRRWSI